MSQKSKKCGYNAKILRIDLTSSKIGIEYKDTSFYRTYLGGGLIGAYYLFSEMKAKTEALSPDNILIFAPSIITGVPVMGTSRFNITAKSPLTGAIGDTQCGGAWGAKLKHSGFDAIVIKGKAQRPVYIWIDQEKGEIKDATHLWGKTTGDAQRLIYEDLEDKNIEIAQIGPAGENLVKFACVTGGLRHFAGRTGMGAVMGSKNLKAIVVRGKRSYEFSNEENVKKYTRKGASLFKNSEDDQEFHKHGTALAVNLNNQIGNIVTRNFQSGYFEQVSNIRGERMTETILKKTDSCWACPVACKRVVEERVPYEIDPQYGGPEFETIIMLGSNLGISNLSFIAKANELCNKFGLDTISAGAMIAFTMECNEKGFINEKELFGEKLEFGNEKATLNLLEMIAYRRGIGNLLAEGFQGVISSWGKECQDLAVHVKNQSFPAHMPRIKKSQALIYAVNPFGADHMSSEHDWITTIDSDVSRGLGITDFTDFDSFNITKIKGTMFSQFYYSLLDTLTLCDFCWGPGMLFNYNDIVELIHAVTGWQVTFMELMRAGERRINLMRAFNAREGFTRKNDTLPKRCFQSLQGGISDGKKIDHKRFQEALSEYYTLMSWDVNTGNPKPEKLIELGLDWTLDALNLNKNELK